MKFFIYKLYTPFEPENFYIGSTKQDLNKRLIQHRCRCNTEESNNLLYEFMYEIGPELFVIDLLEEFEGSNPFERERIYIDNLKAPLNTKNPMTYDGERKFYKSEFSKEYRKKDSYKEYHKKYYNEYIKNYRERKNELQRLRRLSRKLNDRDTIK